MSKRDTSKTDEVAILSEAFAKDGSKVSGWSLFEDRRTPDELVDFFAGEVEAGEVLDRGGVLRLMFDLVLEGWEQRLCAVVVGERARGLAASYHHRAGLGVVGLPGAVGEIGLQPERVALVRAVLDYWFWEELSGRVGDTELVGKKILAMGKYLTHPALDRFSLTRLARAVGEPCATMMERTKRVCEKPVRESGGKGKAVWQQPDSQRAGSREAQIKSHARNRVPKNLGKK